MDGVYLGCPLITPKFKGSSQIVEGSDIPLYVKRIFGFTNRPWGSILGEQELALGTIDALPSFLFENGKELIDA